MAMAWPQWMHGVLPSVAERHNPGLGKPLKHNISMIRLWADKLYANAHVRGNAGNTRALYHV